MYTIVTIVIVIFMYLRPYSLLTSSTRTKKKVNSSAKSSGEIRILECKYAGLDYHSVFNLQVPPQGRRRWTVRSITGITYTVTAWAGGSQERHAR